MVARVTSTLVAVVVVGALGWALYSGGTSRHYQTAAGEQKGLELADGSIIQININSSLDVDLTPRARNISLSQGEARFRVAKDRTRPFLVHTPFATVRAIGTIFNVKIESDCTAITVVEGEVEVAGGAAEQPLLAKLIQPFTAASTDADGKLVLRTGQNATVASRQSMAINDGPSIARANAWPEKLVSLQDKRLADLVAEVNRYRAQPIIIADAELAGLEVNGAVNLYEPDALFDYLALKHQVRLERKADGTMMLKKRPPLKK